MAGWYTGSPRPGTVGSAIIAGHVDSRTGPGIFFWLRTLRRGDRVYVGRADGTMAVFTVTRIKKFAKDEFPTAAVYGPVPDAELRVITCGGIFDRSLGSYLSNVVVFAGSPHDTATYRSVADAVRHSVDKGLGVCSAVSDDPAVGRAGVGGSWPVPRPGGGEFGRP